MANSFPVANRGEPAGDFISLVRETGKCDQQRSWRDLNLGLIVSIAVHLILIGILSLLVIEPRILGLTLVTDLIQESDDHDSELLDMPIEVQDTRSTDFDEHALQAADSFAAGMASAEVVVVGAGGIGGIAGSGQDVGVPDTMSGFSSIAAGRLKKHASAKQGDYEIALFWDGPSDLDLHVSFRSVAGKTRVINYIYRGTPSSGFLDLDQNSLEPFINEPIEHVRWNTKKPPPGVYQVGVHGYALRSYRTAFPEKVSFTVEIKTPDGVKSYSGAVAQDEFEEIDFLSIGLTKEQQQSLESKAERMLASAKEQLENSDPRSKQIARGMLKNIDLKYHATKAGAEARKLLEGFQEERRGGVEEGRR